jgi:20S proteasome alpha/beta subunit
MFAFIVNIIIFVLVFDCICLFLDLFFRLLTEFVLAALKRAETQKKIYHIDKSTACAISGLTADARKLSNFMKEECLNYQFTNNVSLPVSRLVRKVADSLTYMFIFNC